MGIEMTDDERETRHDKGNDYAPEIAIAHEKFRALNWKTFRIFTRSCLNRNPLRPASVPSAADALIAVIRSDEDAAKIDSQFFSILGLLFVCKCFAREIQPFFLHSLELVDGSLLESR